MNVSVNVKTNSAEWAELINKTREKMRTGVAQQMLNDSIKYVPKAEGALRDSGTIDKVNGEVALVWDTPYAQAQWFGISNGGTIKNYTTPGTTKMWVEAARAKYGKNWQQVAQNAFDAWLE